MGNNIFGPTTRIQKHFLPETRKACNHGKPCQLKNGRVAITWRCCVELEDESWSEVIKRFKQPTNHTLDALKWSQAEVIKCNSITWSQDINFDHSEKQSCHSLNINRAYDYFFEYTNIPWNLIQNFFDLFWNFTKRLPVIYWESVTSSTKTHSLFLDDCCNF